MPDPTLFDHLPPCRRCNGSGREPETAQPDRMTDPATSVAGAEAVRNREGAKVTTVRKGTHRYKLLAAYRGRILTDRDAAVVARLADTPACWWKRTSELRQAGYIEVTGQQRRDPATGALRDLCRLTVAGGAALSRAEEQ